MASDSFEESSSPSNKPESNDIAYDESDRTDENLLSCTSPSSSLTSEKQYFGWFNCRPKFLQCLLSAKWALFWMCWAGALQGLRFYS